MRNRKKSREILAHIKGVKITKSGGEEPCVLILLADDAVLYDYSIKDKCHYRCMVQYLPSERKKEGTDGTKLLGQYFSGFSGIDELWFRRNNGVFVVTDMYHPEFEQRIEHLANALLTRSRAYARTINQP